MSASTSYQPFDPFYRTLVENDRLLRQRYREYDCTPEEWGFDKLLKEIPSGKSEIEKKYSIELSKIAGKSYVKFGGNISRFSSKSSLARILYSYVVDQADYLPLWTQESRDDQVAA